MTRIARMGEGERKTEDRGWEPSVPPPDSLSYFPDGGYAVWRRGSTIALLRCPRKFKHRPSQCDLLHFDLWDAGRNLLGDAGSYCYNCDEPWQSYFSSSAAHNTIRFDDHDPIPKLSRFLYGSWPHGDVQVDGQTVRASYRDCHGAHHCRLVEPTLSGFAVTDDIAGRFEKATLRWRLHPACEWTLGNREVSSDMMAVKIDVASSGASPEFRLAEGWGSLYYREKHTVPVLEVHVAATCQRIRTEITLIRTTNHE